MTLKKQRIDVTDRITGKFENGEMNLYLQHEHIGKMTYGDNGSRFELKKGIEASQNRFFQMADVTQEPDQKYVDCDDENGWC
ncbi:YusG family protein [Metabacillus sp. 84]|uniref:YusG family protein n=1 Tax=unclassified Metabacillus TaxID=2675274 RepID=UPI003CF8E3B2